MMMLGVSCMLALITVTNQVSTQLTKIRLSVVFITKLILFLFTYCKYKLHYKDLPNIKKQEISSIGRGTRKIATAQPMAMLQLMAVFENWPLF